jgi:RimJ/RimL family protein N-acetyltransferase
MLRGERIALRTRSEADVEILHSELYDDIATYARIYSRPWRPLPAHSPKSPLSVPEPGTERPDDAAFSVITSADEQLVGTTVLLGIDQHNRGASLGVAVRPGFRGQGLGTDIVQVMCFYAFTVLGLHRVQIDTLVDNVGMRRAAERARFQLEGTRRQPAWVMGEYLDEVTYGRLSTD